MQKKKINKRYFVVFYNFYSGIANGFGYYPIESKTFPNFIKIKKEIKIQNKHYNDFICIITNIFEFKTKKGNLND